MVASWMRPERIAIVSVPAPPTPFKRKTPGTTAIISSSSGSSGNNNHPDASKAAAGATTTSGAYGKPPPVPFKRRKKASVENSAPPSAAVRVKVEPIVPVVSAAAAALTSHPVKGEGGGSGLDLSVSTDGSVAGTSFDLGASTDGIAPLAKDEAVSFSKEPAAAPVKKTKGMRGLLRSRQPLSVPGVPSLFETPEPRVVNDYWTYYAVPQKKLFRDLLMTLEPLSEPPAPAIVPEAPAAFFGAAGRQQGADFDRQYERLQQDVATQCKEMAELPVSEREEKAALVERLTEELRTMEASHQAEAFERSKQYYAWTVAKMEAERPSKDHIKAENNRKVAVLQNVHHHLNAHRKHINNIQKAVLEVELEKATEGGVPEVTPDMSDDERAAALGVKERIAKALELVGVSSDVKLELSTSKTAIEKVKKTQSPGFGAAASGEKLPALNVSSGSFDLNHVDRFLITGKPDAASPYGKCRVELRFGTDH